MEHQTMQLDLFARVREIYADAGRAITNAEVYSALVDRGVIDQSNLDAKKPIGRAKAVHSPHLATRARDVVWRRSKTAKLRRCDH